MWYLVYSHNVKFPLAMPDNDLMPCYFIHLHLWNVELLAGTHKQSEPNVPPPGLRS